MAQGGKIEPGKESAAAQKMVAERTLEALEDEKRVYEQKLEGAQAAADDGDEEAVKAFGSPGKWERRIKAVDASIDHWQGFLGKKSPATTAKK